MLANMPNIQFLRPYSYPNMDYDGLQEISFKNLQSVALVHSGINFRDNYLPVTMQLADEGTSYTVNFGSTLQFLDAPLVRVMNIINLDSRGIGLLDRIGDRSSALNDLQILGTNIHAATLEKFLRFPRSLRSLVWH